MSVTALRRVLPRQPAPQQQITSTYTAKNSGDYIRYSVYASNFASSSQNFLADCLSLWSP
jgi:hypothetical protein